MAKIDRLERYDTQALGQLLGMGLGVAASATVNSSSASMTPPETLQSDLSKLDQHLPPSSNTPYTTEDIANVLRDPKTGQPAHVDGSPLKDGELETLTNLANHPGQRDQFFKGYQKQYEQDHARTREGFMKAGEAVGGKLGEANTSLQREKREKEKNEEVIPQAQRRIASQPRHWGG